MMFKHLRWNSAWIAEAVLLLSLWRLAVTPWFKISSCLVNCRKDELIDHATGERITYNRYNVLHAIFALWTSPVLWWNKRMCSWIYSATVRLLSLWSRPYYCISRLRLNEWVIEQTTQLSQQVVIWLFNWLGLASSVILPTHCYCWWSSFLNDCQLLSCWWGCFINTLCCCCCSYRVSVGGLKATGPLVLLCQRRPEPESFIHRVHFTATSWEETLRKPIFSQSNHTTRTPTWQSSCVSM